MPWLIPVATAVIGAGTSLYGANKQAKANASAQAENTRLQEQQNQQAWANYLMTRGVNPAGAATGQIPTNPQAINARLPLWASANFARPGARKTWRKIGSSPTPGTLTMGNSFQGVGSTGQPGAL